MANVAELPKYHIMYCSQCQTLHKQRYEEEKEKESKSQKEEKK